MTTEASCQFCGATVAAAKITTSSEGYELCPYCYQGSYQAGVYLSRRSYCDREQAEAERNLGRYMNILEDRIVERLRKASWPGPK